MLEGSGSRKRVLIVDDSPENIQVLMETLKNDYAIVAAINGKKALKMAAAEPAPDIILLDVMMPNMDGFEVCRRLKAAEETRDIPVIFITTLSDAEDEAYGPALGAVDYLNKPSNPDLVKARIKNHLELKGYRDLLETLVNERTRELAVTQAVTIESLATLAEYREPETGGHVKRTQNYVKALAVRLRDHARFRDELTDDTIEQLYRAAPLHDMGKVGVPDHILLKQGKLTDEEFEERKILTGGEGDQKGRRPVEKILLVEDNEINLEIMQSQLLSAGYQVDMALNGKEALVKCKNGDYDAILTDLEMPEMDGYALVEEIHADKRNGKKEPPILAITASDFDLTEERAKKLGFDGYLLKPLDVEVLKKKLGVILRNDPETPSPSPYLEGN